MDNVRGKKNDNEKSLASHQKAPSMGEERIPSGTRAEPVLLMKPDCSRRSTHAPWKPDADHQGSRDHPWRTPKLAGNSGAQR